MSNRQSIEVAVVEDDPRTQQVLVELVASSDEYNLCWFTGSGESARQNLSKHPPTLLLLDLTLSDGSGLDLIDEAKAIGVCVLVLSVFGDEETVLRAVRCGVDGYVQKNQSDIELNDAIKSALRGHCPISSSVARHLLRAVRKTPSNQSPQVATVAKLANAKFSPRELEVLSNLATGMTYKEVAANLHISFHTVAYHMKNIMRKTSSSTRGEAIYAAVQQGWLEIPAETNI